MRSRYSAYTRDDADYIQATWHPDKRPATLTLEDGHLWLGLRILEYHEDGDRGRVRFQATCLDRGGFVVIEEHSRFVREDGRWLYLDGETTAAPLKPGRNDPCPCGSDKKFKKCCGG